MNATLFRNELDFYRLTLCELLDCGYEDTSVLEKIYDEIGDEIYNGDRTNLLQNHVGKEGLNGIMSEFYYDVTAAVSDCIEELLDDYKSAKDEDKEDTDLASNMIDYNKNNPYSDDLINYIKNKNTELIKTYPYANGSDVYFQNDLDSTFDSENSVLYNSVDLIRYWIEQYEIDCKKMETEK